MITSELLVTAKCEECRRLLPKGSKVFADPSDGRVEGNIYCSESHLERAKQRNS